MKWIYFNEEARCFSPTEYTNEICGFSTTVSQPDQIKADPQIEADSNDEDSIMDDVENVVDTPQTNASESQLASEESTRASTPSEGHAEEVPPEIYTVEPSARSDIADDVTMKDLGVQKSPSAGTVDEVGNLKAFPWPSGNAIDPPWKAGKNNEEFVDYASDPKKLEELLHSNDLHSPDLYKP